MKKFRLAAAVSVAVLSMSAQAMAAPLTTNATAAQLNCQKVATLTNCNFSSCQSIESIRQNCLNSIDIQSILNQLNSSGGKAGKIVTSLACNLGSTSGNTGSDCTATTNNCTTNNSTTKPTNNSTTKPTNDSTTKPTNDSTTKPTNNSTTKPTNNSTTNDSTTKPTNNSTTTNPTNNTTTQTTTSVSAYAQEVVDLVNVERAKAGLSALQIDPAVTKAAQVRAKEIQSSFSHTRPDGRSCFTALDEANASYRGAGENIALGQKTPAQVMNDWMNSSGHKANIMNPSFKYIGVGVDGSAWTQLFTY